MVSYDELKNEVNEALAKKDDFLKQASTTLKVVWELCEIANTHNEVLLQEVIDTANTAKADITTLITNITEYVNTKKTEFETIKSECEAALIEIENVKTQCEQALETLNTLIESVNLKLAEQDAKITAQDEKITAQDEKIASLIEAKIYQNLQNFKKFDFCIHANKVYLVLESFTASGNFQNDLQFLKPLEKQNLVVNYAAGVEIEAGENVLYADENGTKTLLIALESFTASDYENDKNKLIPFASGIGAESLNLYTKQEINDLLLLKQDKLTQGDGVKVEINATNTKVSADMSQTATALKLAQRTNSAYIAAKTPTNATGDYLINADYLNTSQKAQDTKITALQTLTTNQGKTLTSLQNTKANVADVYKKTETYTQAQINTIMTARVGGQRVSLEVKDYVISTEFVGTNYEVDLEAIVAAKSAYKKGTFKIKKSQFIPNITEAQAIYDDKIRLLECNLSQKYSLSNYHYGTPDPTQWDGGILVAETGSASAGSGGFNYSQALLNTGMQNWGVDSNNKMLLESETFGAYTAKIGKATACYFAASTAQSRNYCIANAAYWAWCFWWGADLVNYYLTIRICFEVRNSDCSLILDKLTTQGYLTIWENQKLVIQNNEVFNLNKSAEQYMKKRVIGGTFYFDLEINS